MEFLKHYLPAIELLGFLSVITFIGSLIAIPLIIGRLPADYFILHRQVVEERHRRHPALAKLIFLARNIIGILLFLAGTAMLFLPGQGIITMLIGISFMDFPGKNRVVDYLVRQQKIAGAMNWMRRKQKKPPFAF